MLGALYFDNPSGDGTTGSYWSSSLSLYSSDSYSAGSVHIGSNGVTNYGNDRYYGYSVRAVSE